MKTKQSLYTAKARWLQQVVKAAARTKGVDARPINLIGLSHELYRLGARGEELYDLAWDLGCEPEYLYLIADHLTLIETLSTTVCEKAKEAHVLGCRQYINLKCVRPVDS